MGTEKIECYIKNYDKIDMHDSVLVVREYFDSGGNIIYAKELLEVYNLENTEVAEFFGETCLFDRDINYHIFTLNNRRFALGFNIQLDKSEMNRILDLARNKIRHKIESLKLDNKRDILTLLENHYELTITKDTNTNTNTNTRNRRCSFDQSVSEGGMINIICTHPYTSMGPCEGKENCEFYTPIYREGYNINEN